MLERSWIDVASRENWSQSPGLNDLGTYWNESGPWHHEPDKLQWTDNTTGLDCLAVRNYNAAWCGYVAVDIHHPLFKKSCWDDDFPDLCAHGSINYSSLCQEDENPLAICHIPERGHPDYVWWFGFDCSHAFDYVPGLPRMVIDGRDFYDWDRSNIYKFVRPTYRTLPYVKKVCRTLAKQLVSLR